MVYKIFLTVSFFAAEGGADRADECCWDGDIIFRIDDLADVDVFTCLETETLLRAFLSPLMGILALAIGGARAANNMHRDQLYDVFFVMALPR